MAASTIPTTAAASVPETAPTPEIPVFAPTVTAGGTTVRFVLTPGQAQDDILDLNEKKWSWPITL